MVRIRRSSQSEPKVGSQPRQRLLRQNQKSTANSGPEIHSKSGDLLLISGPGETLKIAWGLQINSKFRARNQQQIPGFAVDFRASKLPGGSKSTANSGPEINSKSRDLLLISGPGETLKIAWGLQINSKFRARNQQQIQGFAVDLRARRKPQIAWGRQINSRFRATNQQQIPGFAVDLWARTSQQIAWELQINSKFRARNQQQIPGFAVDLWARRNPEIAWELQINSNFRATNQQQITGFVVDLWAWRNPEIACFLPGSYQSTVNSGLQINSKSRDSLVPLRPPPFSWAPKPADYGGGLWWGCGGGEVPTQLFRKCGLANSTQTQNRPCGF